MSTVRIAGVLFFGVFLNLSLAWAQSATPGATPAAIARAEKLVGTTVLLADETSLQIVQNSQATTCQLAFGHKIRVQRVDAPSGKVVVTYDPLPPSQGPDLPSRKHRPDPWTCARGTTGALNVASLLEQDDTLKTLRFRCHQQYEANHGSRETQAREADRMARELASIIDQTSKGTARPAPKQFYVSDDCDTLVPDRALSSPGEHSFAFETRSGTSLTWSKSYEERDFRPDRDGTRRVPESFKIEIKKAN